MYSHYALRRRTMNLLGVVSEMIWAGQLSSTSWIRAVDIAIRRAVTEVLP